MAVHTQLPGTYGQSYHNQDRVRYLLGISALIFIGMLVTVIGVPGGTRLTGAPSVVGVPPTTVPIRSGPWPHPAPGARASSGRSSQHDLTTPVPAPQSAPVRATKDNGRAFADLFGGLGVAKRASADEQLVAAPVLAVKPARARSTAHPTKPAHAIRAIGADRLHRSLIYSSTLALAIAIAGLLMLGSRRRLW